MPFFFSEVVKIIRNKILAIFEKVLSIKFPFIRDLGIISALCLKVHVSIVPYWIK